ncbi:periplasmic heavy metal sensor [Phenylobacterium sp.]|uniref:periplasmic heavy metal sensor n=1 Tax=Phenylobacterium sp. TaxID=1871053 RepID=UPI0027315029|nr:periplasmic heavy metal sensor [Phenylobacterium sp.]MDP1616079.1 periplasmic heavy metal sensor [Phenylobacterium sp.]MDP1986973.1 periplasmic heavy metal sensor [Phenylobacterium sp.]
MSQRNLTIALFVSLAVNLFAIGAVVGGLVIGTRMAEGRESAMRPGPPPFFQAAESLSPERQDAYRQTIRGEAGQVRRKLTEAGRVRREAWSNLGDEPFDPAAVRRDLARAQAIEAEARSAVEGRVVDFAGELSLQERQAFAEALARPPSRDGRRSRGPRDERRTGPPEEPTPAP